MREMANYFANDGFLIYVGVLFLSAVLLLVNFFLGIGSKAANGILGVVALGYSAYLIYLGFFGEEGATVFVSIYAFILPIFAIYELVKGIKARNAAASQPAPPAA